MNFYVLSSLEDEIDARKDADELQRVIDDVKTELRAEIRRQKGPAIAALRKALEAALTANLALQNLEVLEQEIVGTYVDHLSWSELTRSPRDGSFQSRYDAWLQSLKGYGFD
jgi:hypothetical protein